MTTSPRECSWRTPRQTKITHSDQPKSGPVSNRRCLGRTRPHKLLAISLHQGYVGALLAVLGHLYALWLSSTALANTRIDLGFDPNLSRAFTPRHKSNQVV